MNFIKLALSTTCVFAASTLMAQEVEVISAGQTEQVAVQQQEQQNEETSAVTEVIAPSTTEVENTAPVIETQATSNQDEDEWNLMTELIEAKKKNEAEAKKKIEELSDENAELEVEVEENNVQLASQEKTISSLEVQLGNLESSAAQIEAQLATMQENTDTVSYEFKKLKFKNTASKLTPFLYAATAVLISNQLDANQDTKLIMGLGAFSAGTLVESTDYGLSFQLTKLVYKK